MKASFLLKLVSTLGLAIVLSQITVAGNLDPQCFKTVGESAPLSKEALDQILKRFDVKEGPQTQEALSSFRGFIGTLKARRLELVSEAGRPPEKIPRISASELLNLIDYFSVTNPATDCFDMPHISVWDAAVRLVDWNTKTVHGLENRRQMSKGGRGTQFNFHHSVSGSGYTPSRKRLGGRDLASSETLLNESLIADLNLFNRNPRVRDIVLAAWVKDPKDVLGVERELFERLEYTDLYVDRITELAILEPDQALRLFWQILSEAGARNFVPDNVLRLLRTGERKGRDVESKQGGKVMQSVMAAIEAHFSNASIPVINDDVFSLLLKQIDQSPAQFAKRVHTQGQMSLIVDSLPNLPQLADALKENADRIGPLSFVIEAPEFANRFGETALEELCRLVPGLKETLDSYK